MGERSCLRPHPMTSPLWNNRPSVSIRRVLVLSTAMANAHVALMQFVIRLWCLFIVLSVTTISARKSSGGGGYGRYSHSGHGGSHSYPSSTGLSGTHTGGHSYQPGYGNNAHSNGGHTYPQSTGYSGNNQVQKQQTTHQYNTGSHHKTEVHHHYHYSPPQQVSYGSVHYPVYHSPPPVYVYQYKDSGSRFDNLLTGLALYNLGRMSASNHHYYNEHRNYIATPGEVCKLGILRSNGDYEETRIDCKLISSFIWDSEIHTDLKPKNTVTTSVVNVTQVHNGDGNKTVTISVSNTTVDALEAKGQSIQVTPSMTCYMIRTSRDTSYLKKEIKCGVLQAYARNSWRSNSAERLVCILPVVLLSQLLLFQG
jgi:hypothetical protein